MATVDLIVRLFCGVDDRIGPEPKHVQARLWPSIHTCTPMFSSAPVEVRVIGIIPTSEAYLRTIG